MLEKIKGYLGGKKSIYALVCLVLMILDDNAILNISDATFQNIDNVLYALIGSHMITDISAIIKDKK